MGVCSQSEGCHLYSSSPKWLIKPLQPTTKTEIQLIINLMIEITF